jgi:hypothetical protein
MMGVNRLKHLFPPLPGSDDDQAEALEQLTTAHIGLLCPHGTPILTEVIDPNLPELRAVREVLEEAMKYGRHGPPSDVWEELERRMGRLLTVLQPNFHDMIQRAVQQFGLNPFGKPQKRG